MNARVEVDLQARELTCPHCGGEIEILTSSGRPAGIRADVLRIVKETEGAITIGEVFEKLQNHSKLSIGNRLSDLVSSGAIVRVSRGIYRKKEANE